MMTVGLTGGIGSGKTTIAKMFEELGVSVYISDKEAQNLIETDTRIKSKIKSSFGELAYVNGRYNRAYIAEIVFKQRNKLQEINDIVHPEVAKHFAQWKALQKSPYVIKESAILFESGAYRDCDFIITVTAPEAERIRRVIERDGVTENSVRERMQNQWSDERKIGLSDEVIDNINIEISSLKVREIHFKLIKKLRKQ